MYRRRNSGTGGDGAEEVLAKVKVGKTMMVMMDGTNTVEYPKQSRRRTVLIVTSGEYHCLERDCALTV